MNALDQCQTVIVQLPAQSVVYEWLYGIHAFYRPIHTYLSIFMCAIGTLCNFCNIVVLTRKQMRTPVNMILTAMACCDTVVLFSNLIYTTHYTFVAFANCHPRHWSYGWAMFLIAHAHLSLVGHSSSVWLSVMLALIRYMTLRSRGNMNGIQIGLRHSYMAIGFVVLFVAIMNAPNFLTYKIIEMRLNETCEIQDESVRYAPAYIPGVSDMAVQAYCLVFRLAFWISGTVFKVIPCLLLTLFVWLLMRILNEVKQNRMRLMKNSCPPSNSTSLKVQPDESLPGRKFSRPTFGRSSERTDRTTHMLLAIVFVFLITELPQGVMAVLSGMFSEEFRRHIYNNLGDILDLLSLCGACTTFIIYCSMSGQFRNEFRRVFLPSSFSCCPNRLPQQTGDRFKKMSYLRPSDGTNGNLSTAERSITMTLVGSAASIRKAPQQNSHSNAHSQNNHHIKNDRNDYLSPSICRNSLSEMATTIASSCDFSELLCASSSNRRPGQTPALHHSPSATTASTDSNIPNRTPTAMNSNNRLIVTAPQNPLKYSNHALNLSSSMPLRVAEDNDEEKMELLSADDDHDEEHYSKNVDYTALLNQNHNESANVANVHNCEHASNHNDQMNPTAISDYFETINRVI